MILSGRDIKWYIETGRMLIDPVEDIQFQQNGIDLYLEDIIDMTTGVEKPFGFVANHFYLGRTRETIHMPDDLMAFVELRSTWARKGIILPPTIVDAGFRGTLTLEIVPFTNCVIPLGERFAHLIFAKMTSPSEPYMGKYQGQHNITMARPDEKKGPEIIQPRTRCE